MITTIEVLVLVMSAGLLITAGARMDRNAGAEWGWLLGYIVGVAGITTTLYLLITSESLHIGVICAGFVLVLRAAFKFAQGQRSAH
jgi:hypothetical protein